MLAWFFTYYRLPELSGVSINDVQHVFSVGTVENGSRSDGGTRVAAPYHILPQGPSAAESDGVIFEVSASDVEHEPR